MDYDRRMGSSLNKDLQCYHLLEGCEKGVFVVLKVQELIMENKRKTTSN